MAAERYNRDEEALEDMVAHTRGVLAVCLTESFHPGALKLAERLHDLADRRGDFQIAHVALSACRTWALRHGAFGAPTVVVFRDGRAVGKILGLLDSDELDAALDEEAGF